MAEDLPGFTPIDRAAMARHDRHFADDFIRPAGGSVPLSRTLLHKLGYAVDRMARHVDEAPPDPDGPDFPDR